MENQLDIKARCNEVRDSLLKHVEQGERLAIIKAPPGSGKTFLLLQAVAHAHSNKMRVAVATQTNAQADDICRRLADQYPEIHAVRFASSQSEPLRFSDQIKWETKTANLPTGCCVVVSTTAKWGAVDIDASFDVLFVEEAWQMSWANFMPLGQVAERFVLIGDPGQIPPVVAVDTARWETCPRPPHCAAPALLAKDSGLECLLLDLPATRRLPHDTANLIQPFYDFPFSAWTQPGERSLLTKGVKNSGVDQAIKCLSEHSASALTLPPSKSALATERDEELAALVGKVVERMLKQKLRYRFNGEVHPLRPEDVGLSATHRVMNSAMQLALPMSLRSRIRVDTPERWQGLECKIMLIIHPLSGVTRPTGFDLETGRLCVMASRHQIGMIVVTRDHITDTLNTYVPSAEQPVGTDDITGRGHHQHRQFWRALSGNGRIART